MRKIAATILFLVSLISLAGCSENANTDDAMQATTTPPEQAQIDITHPLNADKTYIDLAADLPDHIYNTTGAENGLGGTVYTFSGTVIDYSTLESNGFVFEQITVDTGDGTVLISNHYKAIYNQTLLTYGADLTKAYYPYDVNNYVFPDIGETGSFLTVYLGYSAAVEKATFVLGANPSIFEILEFEDPAKNVKSQDKTENAVAAQINGDIILLGNLEFTIPKSFSAGSVSDNSIVLLSDDAFCEMGLFAADVSMLDDARLREYLSAQREAFLTENVVRLEESQLDSIVAGFDVVVNSYGEIDSKGNTAHVMDITLTDSWYSYTILFKCDTDAPNLSDFATIFAEFICYAKYLGETPRFDFVQ